MTKCHKYNKSVTLRTEYKVFFFLSYQFTIMWQGNRKREILELILPFHLLHHMDSQTPVFVEFLFLSEKEEKYRQIYFTNKSIREIQYWSKIPSLGRQEPQPAGTTKGATTLRFGKILGTASVVRSIQNSQNVVRSKIHRP